MNHQQIDLFSDSYKSLQDLLDMVYKLNPTGGYDKNWKPIPPDYHIDFYKDLAFIVEFRNENELYEFYQKYFVDFENYKRFSKKQVVKDQISLFDDF